MFRALITFATIIILSIFIITLIGVALGGFFTGVPGALHTVGGAQFTFTILAVCVGLLAIPGGATTIGALGLVIISGVDGACITTRGAFWSKDSWLLLIYD